MVCTVMALSPRCSTVDIVAVLLHPTAPILKMPVWPVMVLHHNPQVCVHVDQSGVHTGGGSRVSGHRPGNIIQ